MKMMRKWWMLAGLATVLVAGCAPEAPKEDGKTPEATTSGNVETPAATGAPGTTGSEGEPSKPDEGASKPVEGSTSTDDPAVGKDPNVIQVKPAPNVTDTEPPKAQGNPETPVKDGKVATEDATKRPDAAKPEPPKPDPANAKTPPSPRETANMDRLDRMVTKADPKTTSTKYFGTWSFKMTEANAKKLKDSIRASGWQGNLFTPSYTMVFKADGSFTAKEQFMNFDRNIVGTYKLDKGALRCTIKSVNGAAPKMKSDKAGWVVIINKDGKLERSDELKFNKS